MMDVFAMRRRVGEEGIAELVEAFYRRVQDDPLLGPLFAARIAPDQWPAHLATMRRFWSTVLLGRARYRGNPMVVHAAIPGLTERHFAAWLGLFEEVAGETLEPDAVTGLMSRARRMAERLRQRTLT